MAALSSQSVSVLFLSLHLYFYQTQLSGPHAAWDPPLPPLLDDKNKAEDCQSYSLYKAVSSTIKLFTSTQKTSSPKY